MHYSQLHKAVERSEFSMKFVSKSGEIVTVNRCVCTSYHSRGATFNIKLGESGEIRKVRRVSIIEFNGSELYL